MANQHPLTDEIIEEIAYNGYIDDYGRYHYSKDDLRAAADWQLEQVLKWLKNCRDYDLFYIRDRGSLRRELKKVMRPTQEDN